MKKICAIVEGDGEVSALPILLRRIAEWRTLGTYVDIPLPIKVKRDRFLNKEEEFKRHLVLAAHKSGQEGWILILLDADDDCPKELGLKTLARAKKYCRQITQSLWFWPIVSMKLGLSAPQPHWMVIAG